MDVLFENMQVKIRNVHIRFEDNMVSRKDHSFNFGLMVDSIIYSMTDSLFQRSYLNVDAKIKEGKSFSMLNLNGLAVYWNSVHTYQGGE